MGEGKVNKGGGNKGEVNWRDGKRRDGNKNKQLYMCTKIYVYFVVTNDHFTAKILNFAIFLQPIRQISR